MPLAMMRSRAERGYILIAVLWMALGLLLATSAFLAGTRQTALGVRAEVETTRAVELARSAVNVALADLGRVAPGSRPVWAGTPVEIRLAEGSASYRIFDEGGKIDLNEAPAGMLRPALAALGQRDGFDAFDAATLAQAIIATRETSGHLGVVERLTELGLSRSSAEAAVQVFTVYNFTPRINPRTAPVTALAAVPGIGESDIPVILQRRAAGRSMPRLGTAVAWLSEQPGRVFTIEAEAELAGGTTARIRALVGQRGLSFRSNRMQYDVLEWRILR